MNYRIDDFYKAIDGFAPFSTAESWDNSGLLIGSSQTDVTAALIALDLTEDSLNEAEAIGANLIVTHHPAIYPSVGRIGGESLLHRAIRSNIAVISAHTNFDIADGGVNDALASILELDGARVLDSAATPGLGRIGKLPRPMTSDEFAEFVKEKLNAGCVRYTQGRSITVAAVCGGSCAELWRDASKAGAQALVTAEVKHHQFLEAHESGFTLVDSGHFATEAVSIIPLAELLSRSLPDAVIVASKSQKDPARYA